MKPLIFIWLSIYFLSLPCSDSYASWQEPIAIVSGGWGSTDDQLGFKHGDTNDMFAGPFYVLSDGSIIIRDVLNARFKVYNYDGSIKKVLKCREITSNLYNEECNFDGDYLQGTLKGNVWTDKSSYQWPKYSLYSTTGQLIKTSTARPSELGIVKSANRQSDGSYVISIQYVDAIYTFKSPKMLEYFTHDTSGYLYAVTKMGSGKKMYYQVTKYNKCGKVLGLVNLPQNNIMRQPETIPPWPVARITILEQYGKPIIASNGDVYAWKRTPDTYSILKWTWVNDAKAAKEDCSKQDTSPK